MSIKTKSEAETYIACLRYPRVKSQGRLHRFRTCGNALPFWKGLSKNFFCFSEKDVFVGLSFIIISPRSYIYLLSLAVWWHKLNLLWSLSLTIQSFPSSNHRYSRPRIAAIAILLMIFVTGLSPSFETKYLGFWNKQPFWKQNSTTSWSIITLSRPGSILYGYWIL